MKLEIEVADVTELRLAAKQVACEECWDVFIAYEQLTGPIPSDQIVFAAIWLRENVTKGTKCQRVRSMFVRIPGWVDVPTLLKLVAQEANLLKDVTVMSKRIDKALVDGERL